MIKAYLAAFPMLYEGEDIEVRYSIFEDDVLIKKESIFLAYMKPAVVGLSSVITLLRNLEQYKEKEITVVLNDASLYEVLKGASTTKNGDVIKMANQTKRQQAKFQNLFFINVTKDKNALARWKEILQA
ncbi:MAG: hypothetical protein AB9836_11555 [Aminipila sp.]